MGRRKFAKAAEAVRHFRLVSRSQNDPNIDDPDCAPLVLEPFVPPGAQRRSKLSAEELLQIPESLQVLGPEVFGLERTTEDGRAVKKAAEAGSDLGEEGLEGDCYFPKDGYNYEQHLMRMSGGKAGGKVGVVLEAPQKMPPEELRRQPPTTQEEAELLRALDHAEEYEELEVDELDGFLPGGVLQPDLVLWGPTVLDNADLPDLGLLRARAAVAYDDHDEQSSCAEGPTARTRQAAPACDPAEFDEFLAEEYGEDAIGACDEDDDIEGPVTMEQCEDLLDEYISGREAEANMLHSINEPKKGCLDDVPRVIEETRAIIEKFYSRHEDSGEETSSGEASEDESRTWDCESVLSTLSNVSNRPGKIGRIKSLKKPAAAPLGAIQEASHKSEQKAKDDSDDEDSVVELPDVVTIRPRGETAEERKLRKAGVREMRRVCRKMKKESKEMYKSEAAKMPGQQATADLRAKVRCLKL